MRGCSRNTAFLVAAVGRTQRLVCRAIHDHARPCSPVCPTGARSAPHERLDQNVEVHEHTNIEDEAVPVRFPVAERLFRPVPEVVGPLQREVGIRAEQSCPSGTGQPRGGLAVSRGDSRPNVVAIRMEPRTPVRGGKTRRGLRVPKATHPPPTGRERKTLSLFCNVSPVFVFRPFTKGMTNLW